MSILYTAKVRLRSGRDGSVRAEDGNLDVRLALPVALGGDGKGTNPEQLFAAGYGACFASTLATLGKAGGTPLTSVDVEAEVDILLEGGTYDLGIRLKIDAKGVDDPVLRDLVERAKLACPYSRATKNNVTASVILARA